MNSQNSMCYSTIPNKINQLIELKLFCERNLNVNFSIESFFAFYIRRIHKIVFNLFHMKNESEIPSYIICLNFKNGLTKLLYTNISMNLSQIFSFLKINNDSFTWYDFNNNIIDPKIPLIKQIKDNTSIISLYQFSYVKKLNFNFNEALLNDYIIHKNANIEKFKEEISIESLRIQDLKLNSFDSNQKAHNIYEKFIKNIQNPPTDDLNYIEDFNIPKKKISTEPLPPFWDINSLDDQNYFDYLLNNSEIKTSSFQSKKLLTKWNW